MESIAVPHSGNGLLNSGDLHRRGPFLREMSCSVIHQLLFTNYLHPACLWIKWAHCGRRGEVIISQHNIIADGLAALGNDRHLGHVHPGPARSREQREHNVPMCRADPEAWIWESLSTDTLHSTHAQLSITVTTLLKFSSGQISAGQFSSFPIRPDCWSPISFTKPPSSVNPISLQMEFGSLKIKENLRKCATYTHVNKPTYRQTCRSVCASVCLWKYANLFGCCFTFRKFIYCICRKKA